MIVYLESLSAAPEYFTIQEDLDAPLYVLSLLEANSYISPWTVEYLEFTFRDIGRQDLLSIVTEYKESEEYKDAVREREGSKGDCEVLVIFICTYTYS